MTGNLDPSKIPVGLHRSIPEATYHGRVAGLVSKSALDLVHRSPAHYKAWLDGAEEPPTPAMTFGSAFHMALLEPERFARKYVVEPDFGNLRTNAGKAARDAWREANAGVTSIDAEDLATIRAMEDSIRSHPLAARMIAGGEPELTVRWTDAETGLPCKLRADYYVEHYSMIVDVKTSIDASPDAFRKSVANYRYHCQDALYRAGFAAVDKPVEHFVFVCVEKTAPFAVAVYALDAEGVAKGHESTRRDIATLAECMQTNEWPGYACEIQTLRLPPWAA